MPHKSLRLLRKRIEIGVAVVAVILIVGFAISSNGVWLWGANMQEVLRVTSVLAIMAFGVALVITTGEIDISVGSTFGFVGIVYMALAIRIGNPLAIVIALAIAIGIGLLNGFIVSYFHIPSLIVTLGGLFMFRGFAYALIAQIVSAAVTDPLRADPLYQVFGGASLFGINDAIFWALILLVVLNYILFLTPIGNHLLATGGNALSAHSRGVNITYIKWGAFVACAFLAGLAGIMEASNLGFVDGSFGRQRELQAIAAAVLGGCALSGGRTSLIGTFIGAFILSGIQSFLVIKAIQPQWFILLVGLLIVLVSLADRGLGSLIAKVSK